MKSLALRSPEKFWFVAVLNTTNIGLYFPGQIDMIVCIKFHV
ncbi:MAG TPA: hypothetical protein VE944_18705 [Nostoc sp.]|nr:hypothetical protein [Nostoc sp.]HYX16357.1 hypothetical protein [Nostoc sp.]